VVLLHAVPHLSWSHTGEPLSPARAAERSSSRVCVLNAMASIDTTISPTAMHPASAVCFAVSGHTLQVRSHARTNTHTMHTQSRHTEGTHTHTYMHMHMHMHMHTLAGTGTGSDTGAHRHTDTLKNTHNTYTTNTLTYEQISAHTNTRTYILSLSHTHTHIQYTYTHLPASCARPWSRTPAIQAAGSKELC